MSEKQCHIQLPKLLLIQLIPPSGINLFVEHDHIKYALMDKAKLVKRLNAFTFESQISRGYGYILSGDIDAIREAEAMYNKQQMVTAAQKFQGENVKMCHLLMTNPYKSTG